MDWLNIYENFTDLPTKEQHRLFEAIKETLFPAPKVQGLLGDIREAKIKALLKCIFHEKRAVPTVIQHDCGNGPKPATDMRSGFTRKRKDGILPLVAHAIRRQFRKRQLQDTDRLSNAFLLFAINGGNEGLNLRISKVFLFDANSISDESHLEYPVSSQQIVPRQQDECSGGDPDDWFPFMESQPELLQEFRKPRNKHDRHARPQQEVQVASGSVVQTAGTNEVPEREKFGIPYFPGKVAARVPIMFADKPDPLVREHHNGLLAVAALVFPAQNGPDFFIAVQPERFHHRTHLLSAKISLFFISSNSSCVISF